MVHHINSNEKQAATIIMVIYNTLIIIILTYGGIWCITIRHSNSIEKQIIITTMMAIYNGNTHGVDI